LPVRLATGAFILNSGLSKWQTSDTERDKRLHEMATTAYPMFENIEPEAFSRLLATGEVALGGALLAPFVSPALAGLGLTAFSGGLVGLYLRTPGTRQENSIRPSSQGIPLAKDVWMLAIGAGLVVDAASESIRSVFRRSKKKK
jgi:hypothetical protein